MLADPDPSVGDHLRCQHRVLERRRTRIEDLLSFIEKEREANRVGISLTRSSSRSSVQTGSASSQHRPSNAGRTPRRGSIPTAHRRYTKSDWVEVNSEAAPNTPVSPRCSNEASPAMEPLRAS